MSERAIARIEPANPIHRPELPAGMDVMSLANVLAKSGYFADAREAAQACVKVLAGQELGFPAIASMTGIYIVKGRVSLSANLIAAAIKRSGRYNYRVVSLSEEGCTIQFYEDGKEIGESSFTKKNASDAGLLGSETWKKFARNMYFARAMSNGARWFCPDVFSGPVYTPEELGAEVDEEGNAVQAIQQAPAPAPQPKAQPTLAERCQAGEAKLRELFGLAGYDLESIEAAMAEFATIDDGEAYFAAMKACAKAVRDSQIQPEAGITLTEQIATFLPAVGQALEDWSETDGS